MNYKTVATTFLQKKNNAKSTLATVGGINDTATAMDVQTGDGAKFPAAPFNVTLYTDSGGPANGEIVKVTSKGTGDNWTIVRAQESTTAQTWAQGTKVELLVSAKLLQDLDTAVNNLEKRVQVVVATDGSGDYNTDGTADQTEINQAISDLPAGGGIVLLKAGTYTINGNINILKNNVTLRGEGKVTKIFLANSSNVDMVQVGNGTTIANDCVVEDIFFDGNRANQTSLGALLNIYGSAGTKALRNVIRGCRFYNALTDAVKLIYADKGIVANNIFDENTGGSGLGFFSSSQSNNANENVFIHNLYGVYSNSHYNNVSGNVFVDNTSYGVYLNGVVNFCVSGNWFGSIAYFQTGIYLAASTARTAITGNSFYQPYRAVYGAASTATIANVISGNTIHLANQEAIYMQGGANQNVITGNIIRQSGLHGIRVRGPKNIISNNLLLDNGQTTTNTYSDIYLDDDGSNFSSENIVLGNICRATLANKTAYGIRENGSSDNNNLIALNYTNGQATAGISINGENSWAWEATFDVFRNVQAAGNATVHAAITGTGALQSITTGITNPDQPRNVTITTTNVAAPSGNVVIYGKNARGRSISETISITAGATVAGVKAFATVTQIDIPAGVSTSDTVSIGTGTKLGLSRFLRGSFGVYKQNKNGADATVGTVNSTYSTVDVGTITTGDDYTIYYAPNINLT